MIECCVAFFMFFCVKFIVMFKDFALIYFCGMLGLAVTTSCSKNKEATTSYPTLTGKKPIIIGHRGLPGFYPDHTIEGYTAAIKAGADFIEPDLVVTKDKILVCRHEPMLSGTTDVSMHPEFADRKMVRRVDGVDYNDWFACDFTLAELKTLKAIQPLPERPQQYNGRFDIPTFEEVIALVKSSSKTEGRTIGIYPETKHPTFHEKLNLHVTDLLMDALEKAGWNSAAAPVFVQSFEVSNLQYIRNTRKSTLKLIQLFDAFDVNKDGTMNMTAPNGQPYDFVEKGDPRTYNDLATDAGMDFIKTYANGIGPWKPYIQPYTFTDANGDNKPDDINNDGIIDNRDFHELPANDFIARAHKRGLQVHPYTFRDEPKRLLKDYENDPLVEYKRFFDLGIDGVFTDFTPTAYMARSK